MLDWDDLRTFLLIARHRTLSAAARALQVQQPTMGRRLEALEQRAGATLLQKTPTGYILTAAGEAILASVERIEAEATAVDRLISGQDQRLEGTVRLATVETLAAEVLSPILAGFRQSHQAVRIEIVTGPRSLSLTKREADVALRIAPFTQPDIVARKVGELACGLYAAPAYLERHGLPDWDNGAAGHSLILTEPDLRETPEMRWLLALAPRAPIAVISNSRLMHRSAARDGVGIACLTRYLGDGFAGLVRLTPPPFAPEPPIRDLWLGVHEDMRQTPRIRHFTDALQIGLRQVASRLRPPS